MSKKKSLINCHTHIFTGDHAPPYLAKTFIPLFYKIASLRLVIAFFRWWYNKPTKFLNGPTFKKIKGCLYHFRMWIERNYVITFFYWTIGIWIFLQLFFLCLAAYFGTDLPQWIKRISELVFYPSISFINAGWFAIACWTVLFVICFPVLRNLLFWIARSLFKFLRVLPGKQSMELIQRYLNIGRYSFYQTQKGIFQKLVAQYPNGTEFVVLQMDMEFMDAGKPKVDFYKQLEELTQIKANPRYRDLIHPFIFVDPRRISKDPDFFRYHLEEGKIILDECTIKTHIEDRSFSGFKIYPALGYYCFDERLLVLWKYAEQNSIPVMTHCIRGTIFYRGKKEKAWDYHPVFEQANGNRHFGKLLLPEIKNVEFQVNFTHPLNYLCLLERSLLQKVIGNSQSDELKKVFGWSSQGLEHGLEGLKICFAHFGGDDEWKRYFELDRDNFSSQVVKNPDVGIRFLEDTKGHYSRGKIELLWKHCDWYSIICSLMLQYDNIYSDISYISHDNAIHTLLKRTLQRENSKLRKRVLFGTDFYVVRNHKSEKQIMADTIGGLTEDEFDQIARINPRSFLSRVN